MERVDPVQAELHGVVAQLRELAHNGARASEMLHYVREEYPLKDSVFVIRCLCHAFDVRIRDCLIVDRWRGTGGDESDEDVDRVLGRYLAAYREGKCVDWDYDDD